MDCLGKILGIDWDLTEYYKVYGYEFISILYEEDGAKLVV